MGAPRPMQEHLPNARDLNRLGLPGILHQVWSDTITMKVKNSRIICEPVPYSYEAEIYEKRKR